MKNYHLNRTALYLLGQYLNLMHFNMVSLDVIASRRQLKATKMERSYWQNHFHWGTPFYAFIVNKYFQILPISNIIFQ